MIPLFILAIENDDDREFMTELYTQYQRLIYHTVRQITQDNWAIDDIVHTFAGTSVANNTNQLIVGTQVPLGNFGPQFRHSHIAAGGKKYTVQVAGLKRRNNNPSFFWKSIL